MTREDFQRRAGEVWAWFRAWPLLVQLAVALAVLLVVLYATGSLRAVWWHHEDNVTDAKIAAKDAEIEQQKQTIARQEGEQAVLKQQLADKDKQLAAAEDQIQQLSEKAKTDDQNITQARTRYRAARNHTSTSTALFRVATGSADAFGTVSHTDTLWHSLTGVFDGGLSTNANRAKLYLDGVQQTLSFTGTIPATAPTSSASIRLGANEAAATFADGDIAHFFEWKRALRADEVERLARNPLALATPLVRYLPLVDPAGLDPFGAMGIFGL